MKYAFRPPEWADATHFSGSATVNQSAFGITLGA
jgi:hypothetical protein